MLGGMSRSAGLWLLLSLALLVAGLGAARRALTPRAAGDTVQADVSGAARATSSGQPPRAPAAGSSGGEPKGPLRYLAIGGGSTPESTEISLEQNLALARDTLPGPGRLLFAGGEGSLSVRALRDDAPSDALLVQLGDLFSPRNGRDSRYQATALHARAASAKVVEAELARAFADGDAPLLVYVAAHGEQGDTARENSVVLWGGRALSVTRLAELHDAHPRRPLRLLSASCYSGGFAELIWNGADEKEGVARAPRCGLFAGTWDRQTSGCDPDPDRRKQEGYSLHVLQALRGRDRDGAALPLRELDFDGDGRVSLLEAHAHAAIAAQSIDVPTTTSERYLRAVETRSAAPDPALVPEEAAVAARLGAELGLSTPAAVRARWDELDARLRALDDKFDAADDAADRAYAELSGRLLARWPVLDDAFHPDFAATLQKDRAAIANALSSWPEAQRYDAAQGDLDEIDQRRQRVEVEEALVTRLLRAHETLGLASALHARGGEAWAHYRALLACERFVPIP
jgi:hypothetical protein